MLGRWGSSKARKFSLFTYLLHFTFSIIEDPPHVDCGMKVLRNSFSGMSHTFHLYRIHWRWSMKSAFYPSQTNLVPIHRLGKMEGLVTLRRKPEPKRRFDVYARADASSYCATTRPFWDMKAKLQNCLELEEIFFKLKLPILWTLETYTIMCDNRLVAWCPKEKLPIDMSKLDEHRNLAEIKHTNFLY